MSKFVDSRTVDSGTKIMTDVCVIGSGAAGISIAHELINSAVTVTLLESGGLEFDEETQKLYDGVTTGVTNFPLSSARMRYFGGATNHWAGTCRPLDDADFEKRDWVPHSGWPIKKQDLLPYYETAQKMCQLGPFKYTAAQWTTEKEKILPLDPQNIQQEVFQSSPPTRFGEVYRDAIRKARNVTTYLYANVLSIEANKNEKEIEYVKVGTLNKREFTVHAKYFVLATGGIENARILLLSRSVFSRGIGNRNDLVGRYFMDHLLQKTSARLLLDSTRTGKFYRRHEIDSTTIKGNMSLSDTIKKKEQLLNAGTGIRPGNGNGIKEAIKYARDRFAEENLPDEFLSRVTDIMLKDVSLWEFAYFTEQAPNPNSRVTLIDDKDRFGLNRVKLHWDFTELDEHSFYQTHKMFGLEFGRVKLGRLGLLEIPQGENWYRKITGSFHHIGTTRMSSDEKTGVVDKDCRIHGLSNIYVAGSSVFPTCGYANPTLTIVALAARLANHLKGLLT